MNVRALCCLIFAIIVVGCGGSGSSTEEDHNRLFLQEQLDDHRFSPQAGSKYCYYFDVRLDADELRSAGRTSFPYFMLSRDRDFCSWQNGTFSFIQTSARMACRALEKVDGISVISSSVDHVRAEDIPAECVPDIFFREIRTGATPFEGQSGGNDGLTTVRLSIQGLSDLRPADWGDFRVMRHKLGLPIHDIINVDESYVLLRLDLTHLPDIRVCKVLEEYPLTWAARELQACARIEAPDPS
ncbi:hypothetical protein [Henriciella aquimarina]|uniref:hypothetical protein n=1 Tax=Henriciella aquimarina TaxID=545261 RepID=UPI000A0328CF|nr:hypothetical protein [Henriciella aquimarina]